MDLKLFGKLPFLGISLLLLAHLSACAKNKADYGTLEEIIKPNQIATTVFENFNQAEQSILNTQKKEDKEILDQKMEDLLDQYLKLGVNVKEGLVYETTVNYEGYSRLRSNRDLKFLKLSEAIRSKIETPDSTLNKTNKEVKALAINAYNFTVMKLITRNYIFQGKPLNSIRDLRNRFDFDKDSIFKNPKVLVFSGRTMTLDQLQNLALNIPDDEKVFSAQNDFNTIDRPNSNSDARVIFALSKGCISCAVLLDEAYRANKLDEQLNEITRLSFRIPLFFKNDHIQKITSISGLFRQHDDVFKGQKNNLSKFFQTFGPFRIYNNIEYLTFDWSLNQIQSQPPITTDQVVVVQPPKENPCKAFLQNTSYMAIASCNKIVSARTSDSYKYSLELAHLCLIKRSNGSKSTYKIIGIIEEYDEDNKNSETRLDMETDQTTLDNKTEILSFRHKAREISDIEFDFQRLELKISQRFRFWSLDMFKKKKQRSFVLGCEKVSIP